MWKRCLSHHSNMKRARKMVSEEAVAQQVEAVQAKSRAQASSQLYMGSLGRVADDYLPGVTPGIALRAKNELSNRMAEGKIRKDLPKFALKTLLDEAKDIYVRYQRAFAAGDVSAMRELLTLEMLSRAKQALAKRAHKPTEAMEWHGTVTSARALTVRFIPVDEMALNFAQICVRLESTQRVRLVSRPEGTVLRETAEKSLQEYWVFERLTNKVDERWRMCGTLPLAPGEMSLLQLQEQAKAAEEAKKSAAKNAVTTKT